jgi:hypothetical protein
MDSDTAFRPGTIPGASSLVLPDSRCNPGETIQREGLCKLRPTVAATCCHGAAKLIDSVVSVRSTRILSGRHRITSCRKEGSASKIGCGRGKPRGVDWLGRLGMRFRPLLKSQSLVHARRLKVVDKDLSHRAHSYGNRRIVCLEIWGMIDARSRPWLLRAKREKERRRDLTEIGEVIGGHNWWGQHDVG